MMQAVKTFFRRNSATFGVIVIVISLLLILFLNALTLSQLKQQLENQQHITEQIKNNGDQRAEQIAQLNRHLDCIVEFFARPDRQNLTIQDINDCTLSTDPVSYGEPDMASPTSMSQEPEMPGMQPQALSQSAPAPRSASAPAANPTPVADNPQLPAEQPVQPPSPGIIQRLLAPVEKVLNIL